MSRLLVYLAFAVLIGVIGYLLIKQKTDAENVVGVPQLVSIEKALKNRQPTNIRTNATVSIDSCNEAEKAFLKLANNKSLKADDNEAIEKMLMGLLGQITKEGSTETHLSCLIHRLPLNNRQSQNAPAF